MINPMSYVLGSNGQAREDGRTYACNQVSGVIDNDVPLFSRPLTDAEVTAWLAIGERPING